MVIVFVEGVRSLMFAKDPNLFFVLPDSGAPWNFEAFKDVFLEHLIDFSAVEGVA